MVTSFLLRKRSGLPEEYDPADRRIKMLIRLRRIEIDGHMLYDQPLTDVFPSSYAESMHEKLGIYKASDLIGVHIDSVPGFSQLSRRAKKALSDYSWFLRWRLVPYKEGQDAYDRYMNDRIPVLDYCISLMGKCPRKISIVAEYLKGRTVPEIAETEECRVQEVKRALLDFQNNSDFPWVLEDKYIQPFITAPSFEEFRFVFPDASLVAFRYVQCMMRADGRPVPLIL